MAAVLKDKLDGAQEVLEAIGETLEATLLEDDKAWKTLDLAKIKTQCIQDSKKVKGYRDVLAALK